MIRALACLALLAAPASAETITRTFSPPPGALAQGVARWSVATGRATPEVVRERAADRTPREGGDRAVVVQRGEGHVATVTQTGGGNGLVLVQLGEAASADIVQTGGAREVVVQWSRPDRAGAASPQP